jgi:tetratricopeptide (TPR) repeat protein
MRLFIIIWIIIGLASVAQADFYSVNDSLFRSNHLDKVQSNALAELAAHPDSIEATFFLALVSIRQTAEADPAKIYSRNTYAEKFQELYRAHAKSENLMYGDQIMLSDARFPKLFHYLGLKYLSEQNFKQAVEWLNLAEIGYEDDVEFNFNLGCSYYAIKNYPKAEKYFEKVLSLAPKHSKALYNMACLYAVLGNSDISVKWLRKAIRLDPKNKEIASKDSDFDNIRNTKQYQTLMSQ